MTPFGVLADDLTGSCDTGVQLSARGARVLVLAQPDAVPPPGTAWDVVVLNTESRHAPPQEAAQRVADGARRLAAGGWPVRYKKIDSTLRGPLAAEAAPLLLGGRALLAAPAFPPAGRTVQGGVLRVHGVPVHETEFGRDRHNPVPESHLPTVLGRLGAPVEVLAAPAAGEAEAALAERLAALRARGVRVVCADAATDADLERLAAALLRGWEAPDAPWVLMGSAGLAAALARRLLAEPDAPARPPRFPRAGPVLVVAGSRSHVTQGQVERLLADPAAFGWQIDAAPMDAPDWDAQREDWTQRLAAALGDAMDSGAAALVLHVAREAAGADATPSELDDARYRRRSERLNAALGALAATLTARGEGAALAGLVLTGGDIARAVLGALDASALQLGEQVLPGIPLGWPVQGPAAGLPLVTKAGGFGAPDALAAAVRFLRQGHGGPQG